MLQDKRLIPILCMALCHISISIGAASTALNPETAKVPLFWLACYYGGLFGVGGALFLAVRARMALRPEKNGGISGLLRPLPLLLFLGTLFLAAPLATPVAAAFLLDPNRWIPAAALGMCLPCTMLLFFRSVPPRQQGVALGLCMASAEAVWSALLPFLSLLDPVMPPMDQIIHLRAMQLLVLTIIGGCLACCFAGILPAGPLTTPPCDAGSGKKNRFPKAAFTLLFLTAALFFVLFGLGYGIAFPKSTPGAGFSNRPHLLLILIPPIAGYLLDKGGKAAGAPAALMICAALAVPALTSPENDLTTFLAALLEGGRVVAFLGAMLLFGRLTRNHAALPLGMAFVQCLYMFQPIGAVLGRTATSPGSIAWLLALAFIISGTAAFRQLRVALPAPCEEPGPSAATHTAREPGTGIAPDAATDTITGTGAHETTGTAVRREAPSVMTERTKQAEQEELARENARQAAFAVAFDLTRREAELFALLRENNNIPAVAAEFGVSEHTVKFHIHGLLQKTAMRNRQKLMHFYEAWPWKENGTEK